jgi:hypothetical protein
MLRGNTICALCVGARAAGEIAGVHVDLLVPSVQQLPPHSKLTLVGSQ